MSSENKLEQIIPAAPEQAPLDNKVEHAPEASMERQETPKTDKASEQIKVNMPIPKAPVKNTVLPVDDFHRRRAAAIDDILEDGLDKFFLQMNPQEQKKFKEEGEKTVFKINQLLDKAKVSMSKIISLIKDWLNLIPKTNRYFLEQEAKIKADKIFKINKSL
ncbi:MAG: hypothetical protein PHE20_02170 [Patescibacteria group bacterium]|nr:hypothetical protein [Patescibacteria group bacterium]